MTDARTIPNAPGWGHAAMWYGLAFLACTIVAIINHGALYYFDTAGYLEQGKDALSSLGLYPEATIETTADTVATSNDTDENGAVVGSRAVIYSFLLTAAQFSAGINAMVVLQSVALILAVWLPARVCTRLFKLNNRSVAMVTAIPILAGALGSLPFYAAYLMPDIFAPILILVAGAFAVFAREMTRGETLLGLALGLAAVVVHPSHLLIAALLVPLVALASLILSRKEWWLAPFLVGLLLVGGLIERVIFSRTVETVQSSEVIYLPFLTARTIADGPGLAVLEDNCPDPEIATCTLYAALQKSADPWRLTATHIIFEKSQELGSYRLLSPEDQRLVAQEQIRFFQRVLMERPLGLIGAFISNTLKQANLFSVQFTIPTTSTLVSVNNITDTAPESFANARLLDQRDALRWLKNIHGVVYAISVLLIVVIVVLPQNAPPLAVRAFAMVILCGILINAFVCGGVSQPSDRYGARVAFLLPIAASFIVLFYSGLNARSEPTATNS